MQLIIMLFIYPVFLLLCIGIAIYLFYKKIYTPYKSKSYSATFPDLINILTIIINTEIDLYEKNVFNTRAALTNSNFENYYKDICTSINQNLSPDFLDKLSRYITIDAIYTYITRTVKIYLTSKITGTI
jgi:hypothetical protein